MGIEIIILLVAINLAIYFLYIHRLKQLYKHFKEGGRLFGFWCDHCKGKYNRNGNPLIRCRIKPKILLMFGIDVSKSTFQKETPTKFMDNFRWDNGT